MRISRAAISKRYLLPSFFLLAFILLTVSWPRFAHNSMAAEGAKAAAAAPQSTNPAIVGQWNTTIIPFMTVPLHISLLPNGKILYWGRDKVMNGSNLEDVRGHSNTYVVDPQYFFNNPLGHTTTFYNSTTNLFCSGHSFLPDGRLLVTGGHDKDDSFAYTEGLGERAVNIFDYNNTVSPWTKHTVGMSLGRWYPYNVTLANGDVAILGGTYWSNRNTPTAQPIAAQNPYPEKYTFDPNGQGTIAIYQQDQQPYGQVENYPLAHLVPDGRILISGPSTRLFDPNDSDQNGPVGHFVNYPYSFQSNSPGSTKYTGSSALYDVATGKILVMGGTPGVGGAPVREAVVTDTSISSDWQSAGSMAFKRKFHTTTILPDGRVLVSGGTQCPGANDIICPDYPSLSSGAAVINPELWSPNSPTTWTTMAASPSGTPRVYHSIALLLPDATVLIGAGGLPGAYGEVDPTTNQGRGFGHTDAEIFSPPYLFDASGQPAARPVITSLQTNRIGLGQSMQVGFTSTTSISSVVLIRLGSVTHGTNQDQRRIPLSFNLSGTNLNVTMPATGRLCPPGPYMLFILNANGTPSVAKTLTVTTDSQTIPPVVGDTVWVEDSLPAGAIPDGIGEGWNWISSNPSPFSGALASQSNILAGTHQHFFYGATNTLTINTGDKLMAYVYLDPANLPSEIMLQWNDGSWEHRAYWGANSLPWGVNGTVSLYPMGALPPAGQWVRLEVPASLVGLEGRTLNGLAFSMYGGRATWDHAGKNTPPVTPNDTVWVEDSLPAGAIPDGIAEGWNWISSNPSPFSGALANQSNSVAGTHQHFFYGATNTLAINTGDKLMAYVYIDPANLPSEIMLQWNDGTWEHRAYWGANSLPWGVNGTVSLYPMGALPPAGQWVRLEVPASFVGLEGRTLNGLAFSMYGGRATWDHAGKTVSASASSKNVAAAANGGFASALSTVNGNFPAAAAINGDRAGTSWGTPNGGWADGSQGTYSQDWVQVDFNGTKTINEIDVYTLRDGYASQTTDPDLNETFNTALNTGLGITSYDVQYMSGSGWVTVDCGNTTNPCGRVYDNNKVRRQFIFSPVQTSAVRVAVHGAVPFSFANNYSRIVEIEAYANFGSTNLALGKPAAQSSTLYTSAAAAVDGNRDGNFANASVTHTSNTFEPWWQVDLGSSQNLDSIKLWNRTDCCGDRLSNFYVLVSDQPFASTDLMTTLGQAGVSGYYTPGQAGPMIAINVGRAGRYIRVQLAGTNFLSLAEVEVMSAVDLALGKTATQSSTLYTSASAAVDGNRDGNFANASVTHTSNTFQPWWQVDLGVSQNLDTIRLWNRTDCCSDRLSNFYVLVSDQPFVSTDLTSTINQAGVSNYYTPGQAGTMTAISIGRTGRYVRVQLAGTNFLSLAEVEISGSGQLNVAQAVPGSAFPRATASSTFSASYPASAVIDGDRQGRNWGNGGGWNDATEGQFSSDWLQVNFAGTKTIGEIDVYTLRDAYASQTSDPTLTETFSTAPNTGNGITSFNVQYLSAGSWVDIPGGRVVTNNNVWRRFTFSPISTSAIRVVVRDAALWTSAPNNYSRIVEVEAWDVP